MRMNPAQVTAENLKGAIRDRYKYMKLSGAIKKEPDEAFFTKKVKGNFIKCGKQGHKGADCWSKKGSEGKDGKEGAALMLQVQEGRTPQEGLP